MKTIEGYLFPKLAAIGSKSEGPAYFLQTWDKKELTVEKKTHPWEEDAALHRFIARKVKIQGESAGGTIKYDSIMDLDAPGELIAGLHLHLPDNTLAVIKGFIVDTRIAEPKKLKMTLSLYWPYVGEWTGTAPTTQMYDFELFAPSGKSVWKWSKCMLFRKQKTKVRLPGLIHHEFSVEWSYFDRDVEEDGVYKAEATFLPTGKAVSLGFEVKFLL